MLSVVLVEPETPGNVGSVARIMKNFGAKNLVLVNPKCSHLDDEACKMAVHAKDILKKAVVASGFSYLRRFDCVVGTTAALGSDYNVLRSPISPAQLSEQLKEKKGSVALVFGRESSGLTSAEIGSCNLLVTIPASPRYRALNISHAVAVVLYELFRQSTSEKLASHIPLASRHEKDVALAMVNIILARMDFPISSKRETQARVWSRLINKSFLTRREMYALLGFLRKIIKMMRQ